MIEIRTTDGLKHTHEDGDEMNVFANGELVVYDSNGDCIRTYFQQNVLYFEEVNNDD